MDEHTGARGAWRTELSEEKEVLMLASGEKSHLLGTSYRPGIKSSNACGHMRASRLVTF